MEPCRLCGIHGIHWDRFNNLIICQNCIALSVVGETKGFVLHCEQKHCVICGRQGTICFKTFPKNSRAESPTKLDLCRRHFGDLIRRRLTTKSFKKLRRYLETIDLKPEHIFLLHDSFYTSEGVAISPLEA